MSIKPSVCGNVVCRSPKDRPISLVISFRWFGKQSDTDKAVVIFEKQAFRESEVATESEQSGKQLLEKNWENNVKDTSLMSYFCSDLKDKTEFINDSCGSYQCVPPVELSGDFVAHVTMCACMFIEFGYYAIY
uniref:Uncharacterized protein n=1 Tax=Glossina palpalis gambiensis TaxID=67801 RepID=A0A1B0C350_9MUSC